MLNIPLFRRRLIAWFRRQARDLPWRSNRSPYRTWISEMMLQQTQVKTVVPYFERWMKRFPGVAELARADEAEVLKAWEGLGYYSRARNLHKGAQFLLQIHDGQIPDTLDDLLRIPGVGPYSAGAILSIGHNKPAPIVDGNVIRVLARVTALTLPTDQSQGRQKIWALAAALVPPKAPGSFNESLMELGALICLPRAPRCGECPVASLCAAKKSGLQERIPRKARKAQIQKKEAALAVIRNRNRVLICRYPDHSLWKGLWGFPQWEKTDPAVPAETFLESRTGIAGSAFRRRTERWRSYTRYREKIIVCEAEVGTPARPPALKNAEILWATREQIRRYPLSAAHRKIQAELFA